MKTNDQISSIPITGNEYYIAQWMLETCEVIFDGNGGTPDIMKKTYIKGEKFGRFPIPDAGPNSKTFDGWWTKQEGGDQVKENQTAKKRMLLYAHWKN